MPRAASAKKPPLKRARKPVDAENPVEVERAKREGVNKGRKRKYTSPATKKRSVSNLVPVKPGTPAPKPRETAVVTYRQTLAEHIRAIGEETVSFPGPDGEIIKWRRIDAVLRKLYAEAMAGKINAAELLLERGWGKVPAAIQIDLRAEVMQIIEHTGLSMQEAAQDPILRGILTSAGVTLEEEALNGNSAFVTLEQPVTLQSG